MRNLFPVLTVVVSIIAIWYVAAVWMNAQWTRDQAERAGTEVTLSEIIVDTMHQDRPVLPAPHQVVGELWKLTFEKRVTSKQSLIYHSYITLQSTMAGFVLGIVFGVVLAMGIVLSPAMNLTVMPWAIISQTIPVIALAPMIVILTNTVGFENILVPKAIIAAYLSFFPVLVSMVKGLRSPDAMQLDLLKTYGATKAQVFWKLRLPSSLPYFFASLKIAVAASLVGAIVGELPTGATQGLGARMLIGSQFGTPMMMWTALFAASILAALLIFVVSQVEALLKRRLGALA